MCAPLAQPLPPHPSPPTPPRRVQMGASPPRMGYRRRGWELVRRTPSRAHNVLIRCGCTRHPPPHPCIPTPPLPQVDPLHVFLHTPHCPHLTFPIEAKEAPHRSTAAPAPTSPLHNQLRVLERTPFVSPTPERPSAPTSVPHPSVTSTASAPPHHLLATLCPHDTTGCPTDTQSQSSRLVPHHFLPIHAYIPPHPSSSGPLPHHHQHSPAHNTTPSSRT